MGLLGWLFYIVVAIIIFFALRYLENHYQITRMEKIVFTIIIWLLATGVCFQIAIPYTSDIFLIFVFLMIIDILYSSYFLETDFFDREDHNISYYIILVLVGYVLNYDFINKVHSVFLTGEEIRIVLWFLILLFLYHFGKEKNLLLSIRSTDKKSMSSESVLVQYTKLKFRYGKSLDFKNKELGLIVYSIMIDKNNERNKILRTFDYFLFRMTGKQRKLGIMQVESNHFITDLESIEIAYQKLEKIYSKYPSLRGNKKIEKVLKEYCGDDIDSIMYIFDIIKKF